MGKELECWIEDALIDPTVDLDDVVDTIANAVLEGGDDEKPESWMTKMNWSVLSTSISSRIMMPRV